MATITMASLENYYTKKKVLKSEAIRSLADNENIEIHSNSRPYLKILGLTLAAIEFFYKMKIQYDKELHSGSTIII